jgi:hypothetical protein
MAAGMIALLAAVFVVTVLYTMTYQAGSGVAHGARFGALIGLFVVCAFVLHNYMPEHRAAPHADAGRGLFHPVGCGRDGNWADLQGVLSLYRFAIGRRKLTNIAASWTHKNNTTTSARATGCDPRPAATHVIAPTSEQPAIANVDRISTGENVPLAKPDTPSRNNQIITQTKSKNAKIGNAA